MRDKTEKNADNVVDIQAYAHARKSIGALLTSMKMYQKQLDLGYGLAHCRENMLGILLPFCRHPEVVQSLGLTDEQIAEMKAGGRIPRTAVDEFILILEHINSNLSGYID